MHLHAYCEKREVGGGWGGGGREVGGRGEGRGVGGVMEGKEGVGGGREKREG